jgi:hypothetical protein
MSGSWSPARTAAACHDAVGRFGGGFISDPGMFPAAAELGLDYLEFYVAGRGGVLGDVPADVVVAAFGVFEPGLIRRQWVAATRIAPPGRIAARYAQVCADVGRQGLIPDDLAPRIATLAERVAANAPLGAVPLFAGWRQMTVPDDDVGRAAVALSVLREHRGGLHVVALRACRLEPAHAIVASPDGIDRARLLGWSEPWPDPAAGLARWQRAERMTNVMAAPAYAALTPSEREEFASLLAELAVRRRARMADRESAARS